MKRMASNSVNVRQNLKTILDKLSTAYNESPEATRASKIPRLVAVSKTKPKELVIEAYEAGQRVFGENYVQEMADKSIDPLILEKCPDIQWHFIGTVQSNKVAKIVKTPNLAMVETISSVKLADKFQSSCQANKIDKLGILVQVNTSGEENKGGIDPIDLIDVVKHIKEKCPNLDFKGLMTIGALAHSVKKETEGPNPDFLTLTDCRRKVSEALNLDESNVELSMGMSNDYLEAIAMGSTNIRVGSSIFGARQSKIEAVSDQLEATKLEAPV